MLLITGFGPFGSITENPAWMLARALTPEAIQLEVSYRGVEAFLDEAAEEPWTHWLAIGVAAGRPNLSLETVGRNWIGHQPDVRGEIWGPGPISPKAPFQLSASLWEELGPVSSPSIEPSADAGDYLCNFLLFRALERFPERAIGFLHIPLLEDMPLDRQAQSIRPLLDALRLTRDPGADFAGLAE